MQGEGHHQEVRQAALQGIVSVHEGEKGRGVGGCIGQKGRQLSVMGVLGVELCTIVQGRVFEVKEGAVRGGEAGELRIRQAQVALHEGVGMGARDRQRREEVGRLDVAGRVKSPDVGVAAGRDPAVDPGRPS